MRQLLSWLGWPSPPPTPPQCSWEGLSMKTSYHSRTKCNFLHCIPNQFCLSNVSVNISPNIKKVDILRVYTDRAVEKCTKWKFFTPRKLINPQNKTWVRFFFTNPLFLHWSLPLFENNFKWMVYKYCNFSIGPTFNY